MIRPFLLSALFLCMLTSNQAQSAAASCSKQSPSHTVALLELYTSEGCSSCPPADRFVSALGDSGLSAEQVVPLSLHVDYWDYIGWKDAFARPIFSERQRWLAATNNTRTVYTPEFFVGGQEQRIWRFGLASTVKRINDRPAQAQIGITLGQSSGGQLPVEVDVRSAQGGNLFVALYQSGLSSNVQAGENRGERLHHDYVVREWLGPIAVQGGAKNFVSRQNFSLPAAAAPQFGVVAFVQTPRGEVLQALALPFCTQ